METSDRSAYKKAWYARNRERVSERCALAYRSNREAVLAQCAARAKTANGRSIHLAACRRYRALHPDRTKAAKRRCYENNPERAVAYARAWRLQNPDAWAAIQARHGAKRYSARAGGSLVDARALAIEQAGLCYLCSEPLDGDVTLDHVVPLILGGSHDAENGAAAHAACNARKGPKSLILALLRWGGDFRPRKRVSA